jgi:MFS family permease
MVAAILSCWALFLGLGLLMLGNGLQGSLLGLRASLEGFPTATTGLVMAGYYGGFVLGSLLVPRLVSNVGHVRVFAALASLASVSVLLHPVFVLPVPWFALRVLTGFAFAGLYLVTESWLNDVATNETRGQLLSVYMVVMMSCMALGQLLLNAANPASYELFVLISVLVSLALVPMLLSAGRAPEFSTPEPISLRRLYAASPLGAVGSVYTGITMGSFFSMGAVFGTQIGLSVAEVSYLMTAWGIGAIALQWPLGRLSDKMDRRKVIVAGTALSAVLALAALGVRERPVHQLVAVVAVYGGVSIPLYSLFIAHTNDHLLPRQRVSASAALVLLHGLGATAGPMACAAIMGAYGPPGFLVFLAAGHVGATGFGLWRMTRREAVPLERQEHYGAMPPRASAILAGIASRTVRRRSRRARPCAPASETGPTPPDVGPGSGADR